LKISAFDAEDDFQNAQTKIAVQTSVAVQWQTDVLEWTISQTDGVAFR
jgi:hypothetical protein